MSLARERTGRPVVMIGHSRGGFLSRVVAVRRPDDVGTLVTLATPWVIGVPDRPGAQRIGEVVKWAHRHGASFLRSVHCADGPCCAKLREDVTETPAAAWTAIWSSGDALTGSLSLPPPEADHHIDVGTTHMGAALSVPAWRAIAGAVA